MCLGDIDIAKKDLFMWLQKSLLLKAQWTCMLYLKSNI